jgi:hypothetical protein
MPIIAMPRQGRVFDRVTKQPIAGAEVFLNYQLQLNRPRGTRSVETRWTTTDAEGRFYFGPEIFDDVGTKTMLFPRHPSAVVHHKDYELEVRNFSHSGFQFPGVEMPIDMLAPKDDDRELILDPLRDYKSPQQIQSLCSGLSEPACEHACQWAYGLSVEECRRIRRTY